MCKCVCVWARVQVIRWRWAECQREDQVKNDEGLRACDDGDDDVRKKWER